jgi:hypothetical protein
VKAARRDDVWLGISSIRQGRGGVRSRLGAGRASEGCAKRAE